MIWITSACSGEKCRHNTRPRGVHSTAGVDSRTPSPLPPFQTTNRTTPCAENEAYSNRLFPLTEREGDQEGSEGQAQRNHVRSPDGQPHELSFFFVFFSGVRRFCRGVTCKRERRPRGEMFSTAGVDGLLVCGFLTWDTSATRKMYRAPVACRGGRSLFSLSVPFCVVLRTEWC